MAALEFLTDGGTAPLPPAERTCCFTGHRQIPARDYELVKGGTLSLVKKLIGEGFTHFITGGALGFDTLAARLVLLLRESYPEISLTVAIPCPDQAHGWSAENAERYQKIIEHADRAVVISESYSRGCMHARNRFMVDHSSACIAYATHSGGGTAYTVDYARRRAKRILSALDAV